MIASEWSSVEAALCARLGGQEAGGSDSEPVMQMPRSVRRVRGFGGNEGR